MTRKSFIVTKKILEEETKYAKNVTLRLLKGNISWMRTFLESLRDEYGIVVDVTERLGFSMQEELNAEKACIRRAERALEALDLDPDSKTQRALLTTYNVLMDGKARASEVMNKLNQLKFDLTEEYKIE